MDEKQAKQEFDHLCKEILLGTAKEAFHHKKAALEMLTRLHLSNYWAEDDIPKEVKERQASETDGRHKKALEGEGRLKGLKRREVKKDD